MKWSEFKKELRMAGCRFLREGGNHEKWIGVNGKKFTLGRHDNQEVGKALYHTIRKQAGLE